MAKCEWCGETHEFKCSLVQSIEYFPGPEKQIRRVKFYRPKPIKHQKDGQSHNYGPAVGYPTAKPVRGDITNEAAAQNSEPRRLFPR
jgi:hypothetical protein